MSLEPALRFVRAPNPSPMTLDGTRTFLVGWRRPVVVDPGPDLPEHVDALVAALEGGRPAAILLTHAHPDHSAGAARLARRVGAPVRMARGALVGGLDSVVDGWVAEGDRLETDAGPIAVVETPGHAPEHLAFHWTGERAPAGGALLVGDLFMGLGDTTLVSPPEGDLAAYLRSLDRVAELRPGVLHPAHGPSIDDPAGAVTRYRAHREARIERVRAALHAAPGAGLRDLVDRVYGPELDPALRGAAEGSIRAVQKFLERGAN